MLDVGDRYEIAVWRRLSTARRRLLVKRVSASAESAGYRPDEFPDWASPWAFPGLFWRIPYIPIRFYLHAGDRLLFMLWFKSRPFMWWLEDVFYAVPDRIAEHMRDQRT